MTVAWRCGRPAAIPTVGSRSRVLQRRVPCQALRGGPCPAPWGGSQPSTTEVPQRSAASANPADKGKWQAASEPGSDSSPSPGVQERQRRLRRGDGSFVSTEEPAAKRLRTGEGSSSRPQHEEVPPPAQRDQEQQRQEGPQQVPPPPEQQREWMPPPPPPSGHQRTTPPTGLRPRQGHWTARVPM